MTGGSPAPGAGGETALVLGAQRAVVTSLGGALRAYRVGGRDVVVPLEPGAPAPGMHGAVLAPWPNRLGGGRYVFDGVQHRVPVNERARGNANHGFANELHWTVTRAHGNALTATVALGDRPGYPFAVELAVRYALAGDGLTVTATATNRGGADAPFGIGFHPWLSPGGARVDDCTLAVDASGWVETDGRMLPVGVRPIPGRLDFGAARRIGGAVLDDGFAGAARDADGRSWVRLASPDGRTAAAWSRAPLDFWQVCTGDFPELGPLQRAGVAAEPMSCPANAFASGDHLVRLRPGRRWTVSWGLCLDGAG